jgi:hypothetical protein
VQLKALGSEKVPAAHTSQSEAPTGEYEPAAQEEAVTMTTRPFPPIPEEALAIGDTQYVSCAAAAGFGPTAAAQVADERPPRKLEPPPAPLKLSEFIAAALYDTVPLQ